MIRGIDRSQWDGAPNPTAELIAGARFMITKVGQGEVIDSAFRPNWEIYRGKMARGSFYLIDSRVPPKPQADLYWANLKADPGEIPILWVDYEKPLVNMTDADYFRTPYAGWQALYVFIERLKGISGHPVGIYSNWDMFNIAGPKDPAQRAYFEALPFWDSHPGSAPLLPAGFTHYVLWQDAFSDINGLDTDVFNGSESDFAAFTGGQIPAPSPAPAPGPAPVPGPVPAPPPPTVAGIGLFYLRTHAEYNQAVPPDKALLDTGSFSQIGGEGQNNFEILGKPEYEFIFSLGQNSQLQKWALHERGTVYIGTGPDTFDWPIILAASITGQHRNMVRVEARKPGHIRISGIKRGSDYASLTLQSHPELIGSLGTIYKDGHDGPEVHNGLPFQMPYFDPSTFPGPASRIHPDGIWISDAVLFGPVQTVHASISLTLTVTAVPGLMIRTLPDLSGSSVGSRLTGEPFTLDGIATDPEGRLWGHDSRGWSALGSQAVYTR